MARPNKTFIDQLKAVAGPVDALIAKSRYKDSDLSDLPDGEVRFGLSRMRAVIERTVPLNSSYVRDLNSLDDRGWGGHTGLALYRGVLQSLLEDMEAGYTVSIEELVHGEVFGDFLEMAEHLLNSGYKDAAAVIAGSTLEGHLRNLCRKAGIEISRSVAGAMVPKKADAMNAELAGAGIYSKLDQKNVTAWLDLRNKAAHGQYTEYTKEQVAFLLGPIRDFLTRNPA